MGASQLEVDNADLRFVCSQQSERVRLLEAELAHVHSALEETMAGSGTILPAAHKSPLVGQQEHMQAYAPVAPREPPPPLADEAAGSCYSADAQLALVARQLRAARAEVAEARARAREAEEGRGGGGGGGDASARDDAFGCGGGDGALEQLRHQVDFLNARCVSLEAQLREHRNPPGWEKKQAELRASKRDAAALSERLVRDASPPGRPRPTSSPRRTPPLDAASSAPLPQVRAEQERDDLRRRLHASATSRAQERDGPRRAAGRAERGRAERGASEASLAEELTEARREGERMEQLLEAERAATAALRARAGESKAQGDEVAACRALLLETEARPRCEPPLSNQLVPAPPRLHPPPVPLVHASHARPSPPTRPTRPSLPTPAPAPPSPPLPGPPRRTRRASRPSGRRRGRRAQRRRASSGACKRRAQRRPRPRRRLPTSGARRWAVWSRTWRRRSATWTERASARRRGLPSWPRRATRSGGGRALPVTRARDAAAGVSLRLAKSSPARASRFARRGGRRTRRRRLRVRRGGGATSLRAPALGLPCPCPEPSSTPSCTGDELEARLKSCEGSLASARRLVEGEQASLQLAKQQARAPGSTREHPLQLTRCSSPSNKRLHRRPVYAPSHLPLPPPRPAPPSTPLLHAPPRPPCPPRGVLQELGKQQEVERLKALVQRCSPPAASQPAARGRAG